MPRPAGLIRWVDKRGLISLGGFTYRVGRVFSGEAVEAVCHGGLVEIVYKGVIVATHAQRLRAEDRKRARPHQRRPGLERRARA